MNQLPFLNSCHRVQGLSRVHLVEAGKEPWGGKEKLVGSKAAGKSYEKALVRSLLKKKLPQDTHVLYNTWLEFWDTSGHHYAQPDILITSPTSVICLECKLTQTPFAFDQLWYLYKPLMEALWPKRKIALAQVCKNLRVHPGKGLAYSITEALEKQYWREEGLNLPPIPTIHCHGDIEI